MCKKIFVAQKDSYKKYSGYSCAGLIFDLDEVSVNEIENYLKHNEYNWMIVDFQSRNNVIMDTSYDKDYSMIEKYFESNRYFKFDKF